MIHATYKTNIFLLRFQMAGEEFNPCIRQFRIYFPLGQGSDPGWLEPK
jgi:hypothetical protein